jgi:hypothetical protein
MVDQPFQQDQELADDDIKRCYIIILLLYSPQPHHYHYDITCCAFLTLEPRQLCFIFWPDSNVLFLLFQMKMRAFFLKRKSTAKSRRV